MWNDWFKPIIFMLLKFGFAVAVLAGVWVGSALYHERFYSDNADRVVKIRVRDACLRPDWVKTDLDARQFDVTLREMDIVAEKTALVNMRLTSLIEKAERVEAQRSEYVQGKVSPMGGIGGPAPSKKH